MPHQLRGYPRTASPSYLTKYFVSYPTQRQNDLVKRLRNVVEQLQDPAVEPNSPDFPGLASLANVLVADQFINHCDKDVRLHTVLACMEIFAVVSSFLLKLLSFAGWFTGGRRLNLGQRLGWMTVSYQSE